ncbi:MAG: 3-phosphoshikimate 1-carboxyvinyltransferase [Phycisphaerales bacterium]
MVPSLLDVAHLPVAHLPERIEVPPLVRAFHATITPPGSKSLTNRALLLAALAGGSSRLQRPLIDADDAQRMLSALATLGVRIRSDGDDLRIDGVGGRWPVPGAGEPQIILNLGNAGTATRFLAAAAVLAPAGSPGVVIDGNARMRERPIGELAGPLRELGASVEFLGPEGFPPMRVRPGPARPPGPQHAGAVITFGRTASSQFVSAVLLLGPFLPGGLTVRFHDPGSVTSRAYVEMTTGLLRRVGATVRGDITLGIHVSGAFGGEGIHGFDLAIEPDASGATTFLAAAALAGGPAAGSSCTVPGLGGDSLQGDSAFVHELVRMGAEGASGSDGAIRVTGAGSLRGLETSLELMPDTAMTLAVACCFARGESRIAGLRTLRVKETDRLAALVKELTKIGARLTVVQTGEDEGLAIQPRSEGAVDVAGEAVEFETYDDHRMAMAMALVGVRGIGRRVVIRDPGCVAKTYPTFWRELAGLYPAQHDPS